MILLTAPPTSARSVRPSLQIGKIEREDLYELNAEETVERRRGSRKAQVRAEHRQITVMFCDLVESTQLAEILDPEDLVDVIDAYRDACQGVVDRFDGFVARYLGDGILVFFGYPKAHEDDAERAVRAGLEVVERVTKLDVLNVRLSVRVGIATGPVVVGDIFSNESSDSIEVLGPTPNLAARLQQTAVPNSVTIGAVTQSLISGRFIFENLHKQPLKGISRPAAAFRVVGVNDARSRFEAVAAKGLAPFIGRQDELNMLADRWESAAAGHGQVVLMSGEAGIGKSRLVTEFLTRLRDDRFFHLLLQCSPYYQNSALHPVIERLERGLRFKDIADPRIRREKLTAALADLGVTSANHLACLASLLGIYAEGDAPPLASDPEQVRRRTAEALLTMVEREADRQPMLIVVEDLHWSDPTTLEFLGLLIERLRAARALMIATFRPEFIPPWWSLAHMTFLALARFKSKDSRDLIAGVAGDNPVPRAVREEILAKCDGLPLFAEELTKTVLDAEEFWGRDKSSASTQRPGITIPSSLQDSLVARLDQLPTSKDTAQLAALLGRSFSYNLLAAISTDDSVVLKQALSNLVAAGLLHQQGTPPAATYVFKHALLQDACCELLLRRTRQHHHGRIAEVLERQFPDMTQSQPEIVAHHWTEAQQPAKAVRYWLAAGKRASERSAMLEAVAHLRKGLELTGGILEEQDRKHLELEMQIQLAAALMATAGSGSQQVEAAYTRALALCSEVPQSPLHFAAAWGSWRIAMDFRTGRERADRLLELAQDISDAGLILQAHHCQWATLFMLGEQEACCNHIEQGLKLYDPEAHFAHASVYGGHDAKVCALGEASLSYCLRGYPQRAWRYAKEALELARHLNHAGSLAHALDYAVMLSRYRRDPHAVLQYADDMIKFSEEQDLIEYGVKGRFFKGYALARFGQVDRGLEDMKVSLETELRIGTEEDFPVYFEMLAEIAALAGGFDESLDAIAQVAPVIEKKGLRYWSAELHRRHGDVLLAQSCRNSAEADEQFHQSLAIAREQNAKLLELRALCSLVRLRGRSTEPDSPYNALRALVAGFPERRAAELGEAQALLNQL